MLLSTGQLFEQSFPPESTGIQFVGRVGSNANAGGATRTISLTSLTDGIGSAPAAGDLVVVLQHCATNTGAAAVPFVVTSGYTSDYGFTNSSSLALNMAGAHKIMGGSPDTDVIVDSYGTTGNGLSVEVMVFRGVDSTTPMDTAALTSSGTCNPPSITPVTQGAWVIAGGAMSDSTAAMSVPGVDASFAGSVNVGTADVTYAAGYVDWSGAGAVDIATLTGSLTQSFTRRLAAYSLAIRPAT